MTKVKIVGFDLDNTLYPATSEIQTKIRGTIYEKISSACDIDYSEAEKLFEKGYAEIGSGSRVVMDIAKKYNKNVDGSDLVQEALEETDILEFIKPNPKLCEMIQRLSNELGLDLITGSADSLAIKKLKKIGLDRTIFDYFFAHFHGSKSTGEVYEKWIIHRGLSPEKFLYVGDNLKQDIEAPKKLGIQTCFIGEEESDIADFNIKNILDLENILK